MPSVLVENIDKSGVITLIDAARIFAILDGKYFSNTATARDMKPYYNKIYTRFKGKTVRSENHKSSVINQRDLVVYLNTLVRIKKLLLHADIDKEAIISILSNYTAHQMSLEDLQIDKDKDEDVLVKENKQLRDEINMLKNAKRDVELEAKSYKLLCLHQDNELKQLRHMGTQ